MAHANNPLKILCVHQGFELYGSDRMFIASLQALRTKRPKAQITVLLPQSGPLKDRLTEEGFDVEVEDMHVIRKSDGLFKNLMQLLALPFHVARAVGRINQHDLIYINTSVIFDYLLAARFTARPTIVHVHEIPDGLALLIVRAALKLARAGLIFNSEATKSAFGLSHKHRQTVVHNGIPDNSPTIAHPAFSDTEKRHAF